MTFLEEIQRRRTFGIVSHPDAGKTTLTEKLLLFGGAIRVAGAVKSNKIKKGATSDFMEIERQRGISVATSVMGFEYNGYKVNILDTPGHQDFQEDTFRTLTAVDSVIIVIDAAKGVEPQTEKLMNVCRMRKTPVIVFVNKMDRPAQDPFSLMDEVEDQLKIKVRPLSWPINNGPDFKGVYNIFNRSLKLFTPDIQGIEERIKFEDVSDPGLEDYIGDDAEVLREELELVEGIYPEFNNEEYSATVIRIDVGVNFKYKSGKSFFFGFNFTFFGETWLRNRSNFNKSIKQFLHTKIVQCTSKKYWSQITRQIFFIIEFRINSFHQFQFFT